MSTILVGVDASGRSEDAIAFASQLAHATTAELVVASVVSGSGARDGGALTVRRMSGLLQGVEPERIRTGVVEGRSPARGLHDLAAVEGAALLVVGSTHTGHLGRVRPGSTAERLLAGAPCAVAVVPYGYRTNHHKPIARIGVAYDSSPESRAAVDAGVAAARSLGASLQVVTVIPPAVYGAPALMGGTGYVAVRPEVEESIRRDLKTVVAALPGDLSIEGVALEGQPWRELADKSAELDLLLIGSRGYGPLQAVLLGATSGALMREAQCPVIALPRAIERSIADLFATDAAAAA